MKKEENEMLKEKLTPKPALAVSIGAGLCFGAAFGAGFGMIAFFCQKLQKQPVNTRILLQIT